MEKILYIDAHAHAYRIPSPQPPKFCTAAELIDRYDRAGVQMGAILPIVSPEIYLPQSNEDILEMVEQHPDRFFAFCNIDPRALTNRADAPLDRLLDYYKQHGARGIGEVMPNLPIDDPRVQNLFKCAEKVGLPITCDGSSRPEGDFGLYDEPGMPLFEMSLQKYPKLTFIGHGMTFWMEYTRLRRPALCKTEFQADGTQVGFCAEKGRIQEEGIVQQLLREYDNLYGELSDAAPMLIRDPDYAVTFLTEFQDKLFYGSDVCFYEHPFVLKEFLDGLHDSGKLPDGVFRKIVRDNAVKFFGLNA